MENFMVDELLLILWLLVAPMVGEVDAEEEEDILRAEESSSMAAAGDGLLDSMGLVGVLHGCIPRGL